MQSFNIRDRIRGRWNHTINFGTKTQQVFIGVGLLARGVASGPTDQS